VLPDLEVATIELANHPHTNGDEDNGEEESRVGQERVDAKHDEYDSIVAREVAEIVVNTRLHLGKITRLRQTLEVEELGDGTQVGEPVAERSGAETRETLAQVQARRQDVYRDLNARHFEESSVITEVRNSRRDRKRVGCLGGSAWRRHASCRRHARGEKVLEQRSLVRDSEICQDRASCQLSRTNV